MKRYSKFYILTQWLVVILLFAACTSPPPQPTTTPNESESTPAPEPTGRGVGDTLHILQPQAPTILNPHLSGSVKDLQASRITYEPLASFDKDSNLIPFLAAEIPTLENGGLAADGKSVIWKLRQDVKWSDGEPFTADDVLFTYDYVTNPEVKASTADIYSVIENAEVLDPYTIKLNFKDVNPAWALPFVGVQGMILPRHIFEPYNGLNVGEAPANNMPVGTGPYRIIPPGIKPQEVLLLGTALVETNKTVFEPNPFFRELDKPYFSQLELRGGGTPREAARLVMEDGGTDYAYNLGRLDPEELSKLETSSEQGQLILSFLARVDRILLNHTDPNHETAGGERSSIEQPHPFLGTKKVRQAFAHAIDRDTIVTFYSAGRPTTNNLVLPPQYNSPNTFYEYDLEKAKALLNDAGWVDTDGDGVRDKDGVKMSIVFQAPAGSAVRQQIQKLVKKALEEIGVEVELKLIDSSTMFGNAAANPDQYQRFNSDAQVFAFRSKSPDPSAYMQNWTCSQIPQQANNWSGENVERWCNPEYDKLFEQTKTELDPEKRAQLFIQMNDMLIEDGVMLPLVVSAEVQGVSKDIEGVELTPWDAHPWKIKDWKRSKLPSDN